MSRRAIALCFCVFVMLGVSHAQGVLPPPNLPSGVVPQVGTLPLPPGTAIGDDFGQSVAISGDTMAIGAPDASLTGVGHEGAVYIYNFVSGQWVFDVKLTASDAADGDDFGHAVALAPDGANMYLLVGAPGYDFFAGAGGGYIFYRDALGDWAQETVLTNPGATLGRSAALTHVAGETNAFLGSEGGSGQVRVYQKTTGSWGGQGNIPGPTAGENFGRDIAASGTGDAITLAVGAPIADGDENNEGAVYLYTRSGAVWSLQDQVFDANISGGALLGFSVALDGTGNSIKLLAGAPSFDGDSVDDIGRAIVFRRNGTNWSPEVNLGPCVCSTVGDTFFGQDVALKIFDPQSTLAVVVAKNDAAARLDNLSVHVFAPFGLFWNEMAAQGADGSVAYSTNSPAVAFNGDKDDASIVVTGPNDTVANQGLVFTYHDVHVNVTGSQSDLQEDDLSATRTLNFVVNQAPSAKVTLTLLPQDTQCTASTLVLTFKTDNWNVPQPITFTAVDDTAAQEASTSCFMIAEVDSNDPAVDADIFTTTGRKTGTFFDVEDDDTTLVDTLLNADFEVKKLSNPAKPEIAPWVVKNGTSDKIKCGALGYNSSDCAFTFKGSVGESSSITQTADLSGYILSAGHELGFAGYWLSNSNASKFKMIIKIAYSDGTPKTKAKKGFSGKTTDFEEASSASATLASANVASVKVTVSNTSTGSKFYFDSATATTSSAIPTARAAALPAPSVPDSFRRG